MGHHFSTDLARSHPQLDLTDVYAFESDLPDKICFVLILNPKSKPRDPDNFSTDAIYKFHLGADKLNSDGPIYTICFRDGGAAVGLLEHSPEDLGLIGDDVAEAPLNQITELPGTCVSGLAR